MVKYNNKFGLNFKPRYVQNFIEINLGKSVKSMNFFKFPKVELLQPKILPLRSILVLRVRTYQRFENVNKL